jgi:glutamate dehydrogenase
MSSKPLAGINHKTYGVTSEGVAVFLDVALRNNGINPKEQPFTIKITGGPDGDVGGNLLRILFRDYGDNVKVVGIADGSGCAEDPTGISHSELLRLFKAGAPIGELDRRSLSKEGKMYSADTEEGAQMRNTMHNRVKSDVFVPAGGRPNTMHAGNWKAFLDTQTGAPSSPLIVEGANIFLTPDARSNLHEHAKVSIVKDSSANKCGVITSSYEICASMLLEESEFLEIKEELVQDVLVRLRELARLEAELMFREYNNYPGALPAFSERISQAINRAKSAIWDKLDGMQRGDSTYNELLPLFSKEHLPKKLSEVAGDRVNQRIPVDYLRNAFASSLASKLLYKEGINFLEAQPKERLMELAMRYYREEKRVHQLLQELQAVKDLPEAAKQQAIELLAQGGVRSALGVY